MMKWKLCVQDLLYALDMIAVNKSESVPARMDFYSLPGKTAKFKGAVMEEDK